MYVCVVWEQRIAKKEKKQQVRERATGSTPHNEFEYICVFVL